MPYRRFRLLVILLRKRFRFVKSRLKARIASPVCSAPDAPLAARLELDSSLPGRGEKTQMETVSGSAKQAFVSSALSACALVDSDDLTLGNDMPFDH